MYKIQTSGEEENETTKRKQIQNNVWNKTKIPTLASIRDRATRKDKIK